MQSNETLAPVPRTELGGPALTFDFPGLRIGVAEYDEGPTGCTVFHFPRGASTAVDIRGGSVGTIGNYTWNNAICLAGGSLYGLEAASGVAAGILATRGYATGFDDIALVSGAIIYDFAGRANAIYPDIKLGRAALQAAREGMFPLGARGAGRSAHCGWDEREPSGQGGAFRQVGPTRIAVFTVVNCIGAVVNRQGQVVKGNLSKQTGVRRSFIDVLEQRLAAQADTKPAPGNTTLTVLVTNQKLAAHELTQLGRQVHTSMARAIQPFHTLYDGDVLYAVTTGEVENPALDAISVGVVASELAWDAVLQAVTSEQ
jgi:L-aminopeptidase/D-esterase-like protein